MAKKGKFRSFKVLKEDEVMLDNNTKAKRALFKITNVNTSYYSVAYIAELDKNFFKVNIGIAKGKKNYDKREDLKKKTMQRDTQRILKEWR